MRITEVGGLADRLISRLEAFEQAQDRGPLARLRRGLSPTSRHEAWPVLGAILGPMGIGNEVIATVAGCFALHPKHDAGAGNFGATMRELVPVEKRRDPAESHARFRRLLAGGSSVEICALVPHAVRLAKSKDAAVNYRQLLVDLWYWGERSKLEWARQYWDVRDETGSGLLKLALATSGGDEAEDGPGMPDAE